jgi:hypothetical protein
MKETLRRKITVTSSFNEVFTDQMGNRVAVRGRGDVTLSASFYKQASGQRFKDDVNGFSSTANIFLHVHTNRQSLTLTGC